MSCVFDKPGCDLCSSEVLFPTIILCNVDQVPKSFLNSLDIQSQEEAFVLFQEFTRADATGWAHKGARGIPNQDFGLGYQQKLEKSLNALKDAYNFTEDSAFNQIASQQCGDLIVYTRFGEMSVKMFYEPYPTVTDYGKCCMVIPYLDFENPDTVNKTYREYTAEDYLTVPRGVRNGVRNGLKLVLDSGKLNINIPCVCCSITISNVLL